MLGTKFLRQVVRTASKPFQGICSPTPGSAVGMVLNPVSQLDFDAEYGSKYRTMIHHSLRVHATLLEIAAAAIGDTAPAARRILLLGRGRNWVECLLK